MWRRGDKLPKETAAGKAAGLAQEGNLADPMQMQGRKLRLQAPAQSLLPRQRVQEEARERRSPAQQHHQQSGPTFEAWRVLCSIFRLEGRTRTTQSESESPDCPRKRRGPRFLLSACLGGTNGPMTRYAWTNMGPPIAPPSYPLFFPQPGLVGRVEQELLQFPCSTSAITRA